MRKHKGSFNNLPSALNLPGEAFPGTAVVELLGDQRVLIEGHIGITGFSKCKISVKMAYGQLMVSGNNVEVAVMSKEQLIITGNIECISVLKGC